MTTFERIGIIGAMDMEVDMLISRLGKDEVASICSMEFHAGRLAGRDVVVVRSGVGKVNAALCCQVLVDRFHVDAVINTGVAGSLDARLDIGDIVVATDALHHDMDVTALGYALGEVPELGRLSFESSAALGDAAATAVEQAAPDARVWRGRVVSGDQFVAGRPQKDRLSDTFGALCCEMEGAAIAHACTLNGVPFAIVRAISDKADGSAEVDYPTFKEQAAKVCAQVVETVVATMA